MKYIPVLFTLVLTAGCQAPVVKDSTSSAERIVVSENELNKFCETVPCRRDVRVRLFMGENEYFDHTYQYLPPVIQPAFISIYAGETIYIEADEGKDRPINLVHVSKNVNPDKTIELHLEQNEDVGDGLGMLLAVKNPFLRGLRYSLGMLPIGAERLYKTSSCPVVASGTGYESWPFPIFQLTIANFRFLEAGDSFACKE